MCFNLLDEKWIPVLYSDARWERVGIRNAFEDAARIREIGAHNPMDRVAILRFLLALLHWCEGDPADPGESDTRDLLSPHGFAKLHANRECFNLLGGGRRFYQDPAARRRRAATDLIQEVPTGNNFWHFRHSTDGQDGLCLICCALGLLRLPLFSVSGLPDLKSGINGTPPVYVVPWGVTLLDTLRASWKACAQPGVPAWADPIVRPAHDQVVPLLTGLTLLSRRVWLHEPSGQGRCIGCGEDEDLMRTCEFQAAGRQENEKWDDPHVVYLDTTPRRSARAPDLTASGKFRMDRPWPELLAQIIESGKFSAENRPRSLSIVGFATDKAKSIDVWERKIELPPAASLLSESATLLHEWQQQGGRLISSLIRRIRSPKESASRRHVEIPAVLSSIRPHVENRVSGKVGGLLAGGADGWEQAACEYRLMMGVIAESLSPGFTTAAVRKRLDLASVKPNMLPNQDKAKPSGRQKGGGV